MFSGGNYYYIYAKVVPVRKLQLRDCSLMSFQTFYVVIPLQYKVFCRLYMLGAIRAGSKVGQWNTD